MLVFFGIALGSMAWAQTVQFTAAQTTLPFSGLNQPFGVAADSSGNIYIADTANNRVLEETPSAGGYTQTVIATSSLNNPIGIAVDSSNNLYISDSNNNRVLKETPSAGSYTETVVAGASSLLNKPWGIAVDGGGDVYISDYGNSRVVKETLSAGAYTQSVVPSVDLAFNTSVAVDSSGNVYVVDVGFSHYRVVMETYAGGVWQGQSTILNRTSSGDSGFTPIGLAVDAGGNVYTTDLNNLTIDKLTLSAGAYTLTTFGLVPSPDALAVDGNGNIYVATLNNGVIEDSPAGANIGPVNVGSTSTNFNPIYFTFQTAGTLGSAAVVTQGATGLDFSEADAGSCTAGTAFAAGETCEVDVTFAPTVPGTRYGAAVLYNGAGNVLATAYLQGTGVGPQVSFLPGTQSTVPSSPLNYPAAVAVDASGNVYIADQANQRVLKETLSAGNYTQSTVASGLNSPEAIAVDGSGNVYIADSLEDEVLMETLTADGYVQSIVAGCPACWLPPLSSLNGPQGVAVDGGGNVYYSDWGYARVWKATPSVGGYTQTVVDDNCGAASGVAVDGSGDVYANCGNLGIIRDAPSPGGYARTIVTSYTAADLVSPVLIAVDGSGSVYIADAFGNQVVKETPTGGSYSPSVLPTIGPGAPNGVAVDGVGDVYIADRVGNRVVKEDFADPPSLTFATTPVGSTSSDSPQTVTVENVGDAPLSFTIPAAGNNPSISANFTLNSSGPSACPLVTSSSSTAGTLASGASCLLPISFTPTTTGSLSGSLVLTDNALNAAAPGYAVQTIALSGTATIPATTTTASCSPNPSVYGQSITCTATVASSDTTVNEGGVFFFNNGQALNLSGIPVSGGTASIAVATLPAGADGITATYSGDSNFASSGSTAYSQTVNQAGTTTTLTSSTNPSNLGQSVTLIATVASQPPGTIAGSVTFYNGSATLGTIPLSGGATASLTTTALPVGTDALTAVYSGNSNYAASTSSAVSQVVIPPVAWLSATSLSFGNQKVGTTSGSLSVTLTNTGALPLSIAGIAVTGTNASSFGFSNTCGTSLAAGAICTIHGHFSPTVGGAMTAAITVSDSAPGSPQTIALTGTGGTTISLSSSIAAFGVEEIGVLTASKIITLTNTGAIPLTISSIAVTGANASSFDFANSCGSSVAVGGTCTIHGHFTPTVAGNLTAAVTITDNAVGSPQAIALTGTGVSAGSTIISLSSTNVALGIQEIGTISPSQNVTLTNTGTTTLSVTGFTMGGANPPSFDFASSCGTTVAPGASCIIHGHFAPTAAGALAATAMISDSAAGSPQAINLTGTGVALNTTTLSLSATNLTFASQAVGTQSFAQSVTVTNTGSNALAITAVTMTGANASSFAFSSSCGSGIAAGASCTIHGHFAPTTTGTLTAAVKITDSANGSPQSISLTGTGH